MKYNSLEQRVATSYVILFPVFVPDEKAKVSINEQELFYNMMVKLYNKKSRGTGTLLFRNI